MTRVLLSLDQRDAALLDAMRRVRVERNARALLAGEGRFFVHRQHAVAADGSRIAQLHPWKSFAVAGVLRVLRNDREVEFAVVDHLCPQRPVHSLADMFDEHAEDVIRHWSGRLPGVDLGDNLLRASCPAAEAQSHGQSCNPCGNLNDLANAVHWKLLEWLELWRSLSAPPSDLGKRKGFRNRQAAS